MVLRAYYTDLELLKSFQRGTGAPNQTLYNTLYSIGFLDKDGEDEGRWDAAGAADGGDVYALNRYGATLVRYGFGVSPGT
ncbi:hypothetical protein SAMN06297144_3443 [Sphingomonas guangdongensis]|uniref:Uncharacterized protein n=2 Tax=Sphingomonas guangdongensis TaxID=1141890 RepID=A0A285R7D3_9SPHN|nr:hypothetical protein SAMN06297144_3443 [Sphingomonas guangdongensis]